ncbi:hypothetical protein AB595_27085 [Massilia sp. WF1]|nr:hypothetical protein AB595_27085 [Massilia sp. WF1]
MFHKIRSCQTSVWERYISMRLAFPLIEKMTSAITPLPVSIADFIGKLFQSATTSTCLEPLSTKDFTDLTESSKNSRDIISRKQVRKDIAEYI